MRMSQLMTLFIVIVGLLFMESCGDDDTVQSAQPPLKIGVMLTVSGPYDTGWSIPLEWARDQINAAGGIKGQPLELVFYDLETWDVTNAAQELIADESILAVIGPEFSSQTFDVAPLFIKAKKPLVTPSATSGEISRAYAGSRYIWRSVEPDIAQIKVMLTIAVKKGATRVALITTPDPYGLTFFDWFGFFATERGLEVTEIVRDDQSDESCAEATARAVAAKPDLLVAVPGWIQSAVCIARTVKEKAPNTQILFSDGGQLPYLIEELGEDAKGIEGTTPTSDPDSGFEVAFETRFHSSLPTFAASVYDALLLIAYGLAYADGRGGETLANGMMAAVDGRGQHVGWDQQGISQALKLIAAGAPPNISGTTGPLEFDPTYYLDPISSTYGHWRVLNQDFETFEYFTTAEPDGSDSAAFLTVASQASQQDISGDGTTYLPPDKTGLWALVVAGSKDWPNYRHQADALGIYQMLKNNTVSDDRIILILADDIATHKSNPDKGVIKNVSDGPNLYTDVEVDYHIQDLTPDDLLHILAGESSSHLPVVVDSTSSDNILFFWSGHGGRDGLFINYDEAVDQVEADILLSPETLSDKLELMFAAARFRRVFMIIEACHGGIMGTKLDTPGVLLISGANPFENSLGYNYDPTLEAWLSDHFAYELTGIANASPELSLSNLYAELFYRIPGSHVSVYNVPHFGSVGEISLLEFIEP